MWKKIWHFIWYEDSLASWIVNLILAFILVKWVIYPSIGFLFGTAYPIVAVVSGSMEHNGIQFDTWWEKSKDPYASYHITQEQFKDYSFYNGFNKGDIMILRGIQPKVIKVGDVIVYENTQYSNPIIHRVVAINEEGTSLLFTTKGDNNVIADNNPVTEQQIQRTGKAILRIPYLGWIKIAFVSLIGGM